MGHGVCVTVHIMIAETQVSVRQLVYVALLQFLMISGESYHLFQ